MKKNYDDIQLYMLFNKILNNNNNKYNIFDIIEYTTMRQVTKKLL